MASQPIEPNEFAVWLADTMRAKKLTRGDVADACEVDPTTVSRWLTKNVQPQHDKIKPLAAVLGEPYPEVLARAGYGKQAPAENVKPVKRELHELATEIDQMLGDNSPLTEAERGRLRVVVDAGLDPYRHKMKPKRRVG